MVRFKGSIATDEVEKKNDQAIRENRKLLKFDQKYTSVVV